jgi:anti-anti-sigma factor
MQIKIERVDDFNKVALAGRLDTAGAGAVEVRFAAGIVPNGRSTMVDLSEVEFLASMGVRLLISTARSLSAKGGKLVMFGATPAVVDTIETMGFAEIVPLADTEADALALLRAVAAN